MKTSKFILVLFISFFVQLSWAGNDKVDQTAINYVSERIKSEIGKPDLKLHGIKHAEIDLSFEITKSGEVKIKTISGNDDFLKSLVIEKISNLKFSEESIQGLNFNLPIKFMLLS